MSEFLLEMYCEEIPSSSQVLIESELRRLFIELFSEFDIKFNSIETFSTSRRVVLFINNLSKYSGRKQKEVRGPRVEANENAIKGFLKSKNIKNIDKLSKKEINGKLYYIYKENSEVKEVKCLLEDKVPHILRSIRWVKSMRWGDHEDRWIRPIKNIFCIYDKKILNFQFAKLKSNNSTFGNYFFGEKELKCFDFESYKKKLKNNYVILKRSERENLILSKIKEFCKKNKLIFNLDSALLRRTCDMVENPNIFFATFEENFFELPEFLIEEIISNKQDYFSFKKVDNKLTNIFAFISNLESTKKKLLIKGNVNVLRARFSDASFFLKEDQKITLEKRFSLLKNIIFYKNTGTLYDRAVRINSAIQFVYKKIEKELNFNTDIPMLSNADLTSELVNEFPNLQGKVGGFYAYKENLPKEIYLAFSDQYEYEFAKDYKNYLTFILSICQKFDSIVGYFITKKSLKGTGDPFGIRRATLSIIKICIEKKISVDFHELFLHSRKVFEAQRIRVDIDYNILQVFFEKRIMVLFEDFGFSNNIIKASGQGSKLNPYLIFIRAKELKKFINSIEGKAFLKAFNRLDSLNEDFDNNDINKNLLKHKEEIKFYDVLFELNEKFITLENKNFINKITQILNSFFDKVIVNDKDIHLKNNRKKLINKFHKTLNKFYNFSTLIN